KNASARWSGRCAVGGKTPPATTLVSQCPAGGDSNAHAFRSLLLLLALDAGDSASCLTSNACCAGKQSRSATFASVRKRWIIKGFVAAVSRVSVKLPVLRRWF